MTVLCSLPSAKQSHQLHTKPSIFTISTIKNWIFTSNWHNLSISGERLLFFEIYLVCHSRWFSILCLTWLTWFKFASTYGQRSLNQHTLTIAKRKSPKLLCSFYSSILFSSFKAHILSHWSLEKSDAWKNKIFVNKIGNDRFSVSLLSFALRVQKSF